MYVNFPFVPDLDSISRKKNDFTREITDQSGKPLFGLKALQRACRNESQDEVDGKTSHLVFNGKQSAVTSGNVTFIIKLYFYFLIISLIVFLNSNFNVTRVVVKSNER